MVIFRRLLMGQLQSLDVNLYVLFFDFPLEDHGSLVTRFGSQGPVEQQGSKKYF